MALQTSIAKRGNLKDFSRALIPQVTEFWGNKTKYCRFN